MIHSKRTQRSAAVAAVLSGFFLLNACDDASGPSGVSVGGTVSDLAAGNTVVLTNNDGKPLKVSANGSFTFPALVPQNGSFNVTVATQPKGQVCSISNGSGDHLISSVAVTVVCLAPTYTISGALSGLANGAKLVLEDNGADNLALSANGPFSFATPVNFNGVYLVSVASQPIGATCTVSNGIGAGVTAAVTRVTVACSAKTYPVSGVLSGLASGAQLVLQNDGANPLLLSANGAFKFSTPLAYDGSYAVTVSIQPVAATCSVTRGTGAGVTAAVSGVSVICSADTYTISGTVNGLAAGSQVTLDDNASDALTVTANGAFTFATPVASGGSYTVTVGTQPTGETCTVTSGQGSQLGANVAGIAVTCSTSTFTIGGTLSGLALGAQITLDNNGADPLTLTANGAFSFATPVAYAGAYDVTVGTQPSPQQCTITNATAPNVSSNITSVSVACPPATSYTTPGAYNLTVPAGVTSIQVVAIGGGGGGSGQIFGVAAAGGSGAQVTATLSVTAGQVIALVVGGGGGSGISPGGGTCTTGGGGGGATSMDVGNADQIVAGGGGAGGGSCGTPGEYGGSGGGAGGAGGAGGFYGGDGGSGGIGAAAGPDGFAGGSGNDGPGGSGGSNGSYPGGAGGIGGVGGGTGGSARLGAGGGGGGYGGGASAEGGGGAGGSTGPSGVSYSAAANAGAATANGGDGSITLTLQ